MTGDRSLIGRRVRCLALNDPWTRIKPGEEGTITFVDDMGTLHVAWDSGSRLGLIADAGDKWEVLPAEPVTTATVDFDAWEAAETE